LKTKETNKSHQSWRSKPW